MSRAELIADLRANPIPAARAAWWTATDESRFRAMVAAGEWNRTHPADPIRPADVEAAS